MLQEACAAHLGRGVQFPQQRCQLLCLQLCDQVGLVEHQQVRKLDLQETAWHGYLFINFTGKAFTECALYANSGRNSQPQIEAVCLQRQMLAWLHSKRICGVRACRCVLVSYGSSVTCFTTAYEQDMNQDKVKDISRTV